MNLANLQRRIIPSDNLELRNKDTRTVGGLVMPYGVETELFPGMREVFLPGSLSLHETRGAFLFWFHKLDTPLASTMTQRLRLEFRNDGVYFEADIPDTALGNDILALIHAKEVRGVSPGFMIDQQRMKYQPGYTLREIVKARMGEISLTHLPSYKETFVELRNQGGTDADEELKQIAERKAYLQRLRSVENERIMSRHKGN